MGTYKGQQGTWNNYGEFTPSKPATPAAPKAASNPAYSQPAAKATTSKAASNPVYSGSIPGSNTKASSNPAYSQYVSDMGPQAYAAAISQREAAGTPSSAYDNYQAAQDFKRDNPAYFAQAPVSQAAQPAATLSQSPGINVQAGYIKTNPIESPAIPGMIRNDPASINEYLGSQGSKYAPATPDQQQFLNENASNVRAGYVQGGGDISQIDQSLWGSDPSKGFQTGLDQFVGMRAPVEQPVIPPQPEILQPPQMPDFLSNMQQMTSMIDQMSNQNMVLAQKAIEQFDSMYTKTIDQIQAQGSELDPATLASLKEMRTEIDRRKQQLNEEMNRRGLLQSGIWLEEENRLLTGQMSAEEKLLAGRMSQLQDQLNSALMSMTGQRANLMGNLTQNQMQTNQWAAGQKTNLLSQATQSQDEWTRWWQDQARQTSQFNQTLGLQNDQLGLQREETAAKTKSDAFNQSIKEAELALAKQKQEYEINKPYYNPNTGSSGGITQYQDYQIGRNDQSDQANIAAKARDLTNKDERVLNDPSLTNWVYDAYIKQLTQERYGLPTGNPQ